jgi:hypothetical protein
VGALADMAIPAGGVRHHVAVTEEHPAFADTPMVFDVPSGLYWRPEEGGLLCGMSDPDEAPGENRCVSFEYLSLMRSRLAAIVPLTAERPQTVEAGHVAVFPRGWQGSWELHSTVRKVYVIF